jgi:hypothetical protein
MDSLKQVSHHKIKNSGCQHYMQDKFTYKCYTKNLKYGLDLVRMQRITQETGCTELLQKNVHLYLEMDIPVSL